MNDPWTPEKAVGPELARALIALQFPELAPVLLVSMGAGWDNTAYLVNGTWVFRFPRRWVAANLIRMEAAILPAIAQRLPLSVPVPCFLGQPD
jgi:aminoglycoside phosphotransferase (APT) family kinase protein